MYKRQEENKNLEAQKKAELEIKQENCKLAKSKLATFVNGGRMSKINDKGEREFLSDADIAKGRVDAKNEVDKYCNWHAIAMINLASGGVSTPPFCAQINGVRHSWH